MTKQSNIKTEELKTGFVLPKITKVVTQEDINRYAKASGDCNPIHIDAEFARKTLLGGTIAHGMLIAAYLSQMMATAFGESWLKTGKLNIRFRAPARPGNTITTGGTITKIETHDSGINIHIDVYCQNQINEEIITGEAQVRV
jgi:3-hydroxybutyryl-CoA dehydratase